MATRRVPTGVRALGVVRLSRHSGHPNDPSTSPDRQRDAVVAEAARRGMTIVGWAEDLGVSAAKVPPWDRPDLGPWLQRPDEWDALIFWKLDRLCRSVGDFATMVNWLQPDRGAAFQHHRLPAIDKPKNLVSTTGEVDLSTNMGRAMATIVAVFAELEASIIQERVNDARTEMYEQKRWPGGRYPYGYQPVRLKTGGWVLEPNPDTMPIVAELVDRVLKGEPAYAVQLDFDKRGIPTPKGGTSWTQVNVGKMLRSRALLGEYTFESITGDDAVPVDPKRAEPLISAAQWNALQERLSKNGTRQRVTGASMLLDVAFCAACGEPMYLRTMRQKNANKSEVLYEYRYYGCGGNWSRRVKCEAKASIRAEKLEAIISDAIMTAIGDLEMTRTERVPGVSYAAELEDLRRTLDDLIARTAGKSAAVAAVYEPRIVATEAKIDELSALPEQPPTVRNVGTGQTYRQLWEAADVAGRRQLLLESKVKVEAIKVGDGGLKLGRFERPDGFAVGVATVVDGVQVVMYLPEGLAARATGNPDARVTYREQTFFPDDPGTIISIASNLQQELSIQRGDTPPGRRRAPRTR
ncbi:recombinase family protein [Dactylosporangium sp. CA-139114]|uniref:recombinase family protein n=1 Tax=Dactylosporangium sp. CA-139114 TaxID=3239931 RepID=UPI003D958F40